MQAWRSMHRTDNSTANGDSFLINATGIYSVSICHLLGESATIEIHVGTLDNSLDTAQTRVSVQNGATAAIGASWTGLITAGQAVWTYLNSTPTSNVFRNQITISRVA